MARTVLRSRSGDIVTALQLADRTGIVAASAPPEGGKRASDSKLAVGLKPADRAGLAAGAESTEGAKPAQAWESAEGAESVGQANSAEESEPAEGAPSTLVAVTESQRPVARRICRNIVFTCAAALFLVVGWIGGGTWGHHESGSTPALAVGAVSDQEQGGTKPKAAVATTDQAPVQAEPQALPPAKDTTPVAPTTKQTTPASGKPTSTSATSNADARAGTESSAPSSIASRPMGSMPEQLQQLLDSWSWSNTPMNRGRSTWGHGR
jgi:hypothetical protein